MSPIPTGRRAYHRVTVQNPQAVVIDGDTYETWSSSPLPWYVALEPTTTTDQERVKVGTTITQPTTTVTGPWRADLSTASRLIDEDGHVLHVLSADSPDRRKLELVLQCSQVGPATGELLTATFSHWRNLSVYAPWVEDPGEWTSLDGDTGVFAAPDWLEDPSNVLGYYVAGQLVDDGSLTDAATIIGLRFELDYVVESTGRASWLDIPRTSIPIPEGGASGHAAVALRPDVYLSEPTAEGLFNSDFEWDLAVAVVGPGASTHRAVIANSRVLVYYVLGGGPLPAPSTWAQDGWMQPEWRQ